MSRIAGASSVKHRRTVVLLGQLGPAFFTKYLYFAGGGEPHHPCTILDVNVARALQDTCGWSSLPITGGWGSSAFDRYCTLLGM